MQRRCATAGCPMLGAPAAGAYCHKCGKPTVLDGGETAVAAMPAGALTPRCAQCQGPLEGPGRFCVWCGVPVAAAPMPPVAVTAPKASAVAVLAALLTCATAVLLGCATGKRFGSAVGNLTQAHDGDFGSRISLVGDFILAITPMAFGVALLVCAAGVWLGNRAARGIALAMGVAVTVGEIALSEKNALHVAVLILAIVSVLALAASHDRRSHGEAFAGAAPSAETVSGRELVGSRVASILIGLHVWPYLAVGIAAVALSDPMFYHAQFVTFGVIQICGALALLAMVRGVRRGNVAARRASTVVLVVLALSLAMDDHWASPFHLGRLPLGATIAIVTSVAAAVAMWSRPQRPAGALGFAPGDLTLSGGARASLAAGLAILLAAGGFFIVPGHSSDDYVYVTTAPQPDIPDDEPTPYAPPVDPGFDSGAVSFTRSWTVNMTRPGGYVANAEIRLGDPEHLTSGLSNSDETAGSACDIDEQSDAVIPFQILLHNTTDGFSTNLGVTIQLPPQDGSVGLPVLAEIQFADGPSCQDSTLGLESLSPVESGGYVHGDGFLVVEGYYTPNHPDGDAAALAQDRLGIESSQGWNSTDGSDASVDFDVTDVIGPGVAGSPDEGWSFSVGSGTATSTDNDASSSTQANTQPPFAPPPDSDPSDITADSFTSDYAVMRSLAGLASGGSGSIDLLLPDTATSSRYTEVDAPDFTAALKAAGLAQSDIVVQNAQGSEATQVAEAQQDIAAGATVLLLDAIDSETGREIQSYAAARGVPLIDYDRLVIGAEDDYYVGYNNVTVGKIMGEGLVSCVEDWGVKNPNVIEMLGNPTDNNAILFEQGYDSVIGPKFDSGAWRKAAEPAGTWQPSDALTEFEQAYASHDRVNAALIPNDENAAPIIDYLRADLHVAPKTFPITGQDATLSGLRNILSGYQCGTVYKPLWHEAEAAAALALFLRAGQTPPPALVNGVTTDGEGDDVPSVLLTGLWVTDENMNDTVVADGAIGASELCAGDVAAACAAAGIAP